MGRGDAQRPWGEETRKAMFSECFSTCRSYLTLHWWVRKTVLPHVLFHPHTWSISIHPLGHYVCMALDSPTLLGSSCLCRLDIVGMENDVIQVKSEALMKEQEVQMKKVGVVQFCIVA